MAENELSRIIYEEAVHVHGKVGPGMLESAYVHCLVHRLKQRGLRIITEVPVPLIFEEVKLDCGYRADMIVEDMIVVKVKSIDAIADIHKAQVLTYVRLLNLKLGMLLNFNCLNIYKNIRRVVNGLF